MWHVSKETYPLQMFFYVMQKSLRCIHDPNDPLVKVSEVSVFYLH